jgi:hypothetical protein
MTEVSNLNRPHARGWRRKGKQNLLEKLETVVDCLPMELYRIIGQYAAPTSHTWTATGFDTSDGTECVNEKGATATSLAGDFQLQTTDDGKEISAPAYRFVSEIPLSIGHYEWSVEWQLKKEQIGIGEGGWIGVGVSLANQNSCFDHDYCYATNNEWLLMLQNRSTITLNHDDDEYKQIKFNPNRTKIWFIANAKTGTIRARWPGRGRRMTVAAGHNMATNLPFGWLRPCVVLCGLATVIVQSAPTDMPDEYDEMLIVTASIEG